MPLQDANPTPSFGGFGLNGLRKLEDAARNIGGIEVINICLHKPESRRYEQASLDRLLNRINRSVASANRHAFLIFDEGKEEMITGLYRRLKVRNLMWSLFVIEVGVRGLGKPSPWQ